MTRSEFAQYTALSDDLATLKRKLTALRSAAERAKLELELSHSHGSYKAIPILDAAIEASRLSTADAVKRELSRAEAELATLKREHEQLRAAVQRFLDDDYPFDSADLRAALDTTTAEPVRETWLEMFDVEALKALRAFCERASRMTSAEWTPEVRHELGRLLDLGRE